MIGRKRKKFKYIVGDVFLIPSSSGRDYVGQIAVDTTPEIGAPYCFVYGNICIDLKGDADSLSRDDVISAAFITSELIEHGEWRIVCNMKVPVHDSINELYSLRSRNFIGCRITGSGLVAEYLDTFYGLVNRSVWPDPGIVDSFFLPRAE